MRPSLLYFTCEFGTYPRAPNDSTHRDTARAPAASPKVYTTGHHNHVAVPTMCHATANIYVAVLPYSTSHAIGRRGASRALHNV